MRPVSDRFKRAIEGSYRLATNVTHIDRAGGGETIIPVLGGSVTLDATAAIRGRCEVELVDDGTLGWVPRDASSRLTPLGHELSIARGVTYEDGETELVPLGIYRIEEVSVSAGEAENTISITGYDRAKFVQDSKFTAPFEVPRTTHAHTAIGTVLDRQFPEWKPTLITGINPPLPHLIAEEGDDAWEFVQGIAAAIGAEIYFGATGGVVLRPIPDVGAHVAQVAEGDGCTVRGGGGELLSADNRWTREEAFNQVIVTGENASDDQPIPRGVATDNDPTSPTQYGGPFGRVPRFWNSQYIQTPAQAQAAAEGLLLRDLGIVQSVDFGALVNPALEPGDSVLIRREISGLNEAHVIDSLTIPLGAEESMTARTRSVRLTFETEANDATYAEYAEYGS